MMRKIVDHGDAARLANLLLAAHHAAKRFQAARYLVSTKSKLTQQHRDAERVGDVHSAANGQSQSIGDRLALALDRKTRAVRSDAHAGGAKLARVKAERYTPRARALRHLQRGGRIRANHKHARGLHPRRQRAERGFYVLEVAIDVGVVELDRGQDRALRPVVEKFRPFIEKRRVGLIPPDHEITAS